MAGDCLALMKALGHDHFAVVGHDRGALVALRLAMDHPEAVTRLVYLGAVPVGEACSRNHLTGQRCRSRRLPL
jgi:haloacetate dehalogenase